MNYTSGVNFGGDPFPLLCGNAQQETCACCTYTVYVPKSYESCTFFSVLRLLYAT